jgi:hypothetical protein
MSDLRTGLSHDLPVTLEKAKVFKNADGWQWVHHCGFNRWTLNKVACISHADAFGRADSHARSCL